MMHRCFVVLLVVIYANSGFSQDAGSDISIKLDTSSMDIDTDTVEYELYVFDTGYESYLASKAKPISYYSQSYYESWNFRYVIEWNANYAQAKHANIIDCYIDYFPETNYGIDVNFRLYNYFQFIEDKYNIKLIDRY